MFPTTKNFSELTAIDTSKALEVQVQLKHHGDISYEFWVNQDKLTDVAYTGYYNLTTPLQFRCQVTSAVPGHSGVEIVSITVNGHTVMPLYLNHSTPPANYLTEVGDWEFNISQPFYIWYHDVTGQGWIA